MKKYMNPMLQIVSIKKNDIVTSSEDGLNVYIDSSHEGDIYAPGRRFDEWNEGY